MPDLSRFRITYVAGTLGQGGAERQLFYAVCALRRCGAATRVLSFDRGAFWEQPITQAGATVTWLGPEGSRFKRLFRIIRQLQKEPADIVQCQHFYTNAYGTLAAWALNSTAIGALRSNGHFDLLESGRIGGRINLRLPGLLAANSQSSIDYAIRHGVPARRLYFLPNVVDTEQFQPANEPPSGPVTLLAVGRLTREKRFDRFLTILHRLRNQHRLNVRGLIVGPTRPDQELRPELEQQAAALGLFPDGVQFLGRISDMPSLYRQASICVLTSDHEGTPNVLLEAMATGLPVVATNVGGVPEIVQHGQTGFLAAGEDLDALLSATLQLVQKPALRIAMGSKARGYVEQTHSLHHLPFQLNGLYDLALHKRMGSGRKRFSPLSVKISGKNFSRPSA